MSTVAAPKLDIVYVIGIKFTQIIDPIVTFILRMFGVSFLVVVIFAIYVIIRLHMNPFTCGYHKVIRLKRMELYFKPLNFLRWVYIDVITAESRKYRFKPFGVTIYCGRQGAGKTISMVEYANRMRARYPDCIIVTNFQYKHADKIMTSWQDLLTIRNGTKGVIFLINEIHSEYYSEDWKNFPESLLSEISQQRKQKIKICATSQVFKRVVKQIREQCFTVVQCRTFADRWTFTREYDAIDYEFACDNPEKRKKLRPLKHSFIQDDYLRGCYNTYEKIRRMKKIAENKRDIDLGFIFSLLNLQILNFNNVGGRNGYPVCWDSGNGVSVMCPAPERYEQMGYCVSMTGRGIEWYASQFVMFDIYEFMRKLVALPQTGLSLNISRIDIALDDKPLDGKSGCLDLDTIMRKAEAQEYISTSRTKNTIREIVQYKGDNITGRTIYFGSRKSTSFVRIYDKAAEQGVAGHWIRVEFESKQETAMRIVNVMCMTGSGRNNSGGSGSGGSGTGSGFPQYFASVVNHYLRFIELDDTNRSRCSVSGFWSKFLGTVEKASLAIKEYKRQTVEKLLNYILHAMAPSLYTLSQIFPDGFLWDIIERNGMSRLKDKHYNMLDNPDIWDTDYTNSGKLELSPCTLQDEITRPKTVYYNNREKWTNEMPLSVVGQLALS